MSMMDDQLTRDLDRIDRNINRCALAFALATALIVTIGLLTGCGLTGGDIWHAATNVVSKADGGSVTTTTTTTTSTTTVPPVEPVSGAYTITRVTASMIYWTGPRLGWPEKDGCIGESHLYRADGQGGKFDHFRDNRVPAGGTVGPNERDWKNIHGTPITDDNGRVTGYKRYGIFDTIGEPADGEECELVLVSYDGKQRVSVGRFRWVR